MLRATIRPGKCLDGDMMIVQDFLLKIFHDPRSWKENKVVFWKGKSSLLSLRTAPGCLEDRIKAKWRFMKILDSENHRHVRNFWSQTGI